MSMEEWVRVEGPLTVLSMAPYSSPPPTPHPQYPTSLTLVSISRTPFMSKVPQQSPAMFDTVPFGLGVLSAGQQLSPCLSNVVS